ncbi:MAG: radical SAM protein [Acetobacteraceae bacterium]|nr:radical SAM protein [Acetobacteraceae bacterium]
MKAGVLAPGGKRASPEFRVPAQDGYRLVRHRGRAFLYSALTDQLYPLSPPAVEALEREGLDGARLRDLELCSSGAVPLPPPAPPDAQAVRTEVRHAVDQQVHQIVLGVTESCNLRCHYCIYSGSYAGLRRHSRAKMPWEVARQAIHYLMAHRANSPVPPGISFYGGEPLLHLSLIRRCVDYARSLSGEVRFVITTNGTLLDGEARAFLVENDFTVLVSLDGPSEVHDRYRRDAAGSPSFDRIAANLDALRREAPDYYAGRVRFSVVLTPPIDYARLEAFFTGLGVPCVVSPMETYGLRPEWLSRLNRPDFEPLAAAFEQACRDRTEHGQKLWRRFSVGLLGPALRRIQTRGERQEAAYFRLGQCVPGSRKVFVDPRGNLYPCEKVEGGPDVRLGRVDRGVDPEASLRLMERFSEMVSQNCGGCWMRRMCTACLADAVQGGRFDPAKMGLRCAARKEAQAEALGLYAALLEEDPGALDFLPEAFPWG